MKGREKMREIKFLSFARDGILQGMEIPFIGCPKRFPFTHLKDE